MQVKWKRVLHPALVSWKEEKNHPTDDYIFIRGHDIMQVDQNLKALPYLH
jgi:hypothetical protein